MSEAGNGNDYAGGPIIQRPLSTAVYFSPASGQHQLWVILVSPPPLHCHNSHLVTRLFGDFVAVLVRLFMRLTNETSQLFSKHLND